MPNRHESQTGPGSAAGTAAEVFAFPATPQQQQLWFLDSLYLGNAAYNIPLAYELAGPLNAEALDAALDWVVQRHENLRTTFAMRGEDFVQVVEPAPPVRFTALDLRALEPARREQKCREAVAAEARRQFDLARGPLVRGLLIRLEPERHVLVFNFHHIILDHLSVLQFAREFCTAYGGFRAGRTPDLPAPTLHYPDFAVWQQGQFEDPAFQAELQEWVESLADAPVETPLPFDRPRGAAQTFAGREIKFSFSPELSARIGEFSRSARKSAFVTLLTAFKCLLGRYSGQADLVIGSPFSNRTVESLEGIMGCCMNTLPLRTRLTAEGSFAAALDQVHQTVLGAHRRQRVPLKLIVDAVKPERDSSRNPVFQSTFTLQDPPMTIALAGAEVKPLLIHNDTAKFDMSVWIWEAGGKFSGVWEYNTDLFEADTIERMIRNFETLLAGALAQPTVPWRRVPLLAPAEFTEVTANFNRTAAPIPPATVADLIQQVVARRRDHAAVTHGASTLTYGELWARSGALAETLARKGVGAGSLVGLFLDRSLDMIVALLGVVRAGAAYLPLDPAFPPDRLAFMIEDAAVRVILSDTATRPHLPEHRAEVVLVDAIDPKAGGEPPPGPDPAALAYVRYTSGSTGKPKGVEIGHRALVNFLAAMRAEPGITERDRLLAVTTLSFDISELEIWLPLTVGAQIILASRHQAVDGTELIRLLHQHQVTQMQATPATWRLLLESGWTGDRGLKVLCGGEALPVELAARLIPRCGELWNMYGPTETTIWSSALLLRDGEPVRVGRPIANTQFYVVDAALQAVPLGTPGELLIGGDGLARGYLGRPELTAERFVASPFRPGERVYRTGDLVKFRRDGTLDFLGRIDNQVKLRGYRIELGEIEAVLATVEGIRQVVVVVRDELLAAYYVSASGEPVDPAGCRAKLQARLPDYMVPSHFVALARLPLTPNGKVDRKALPALDGSRGAVAGAFVAPRTPIEQRLAALWEGVLKRSPVGVHDNFFQIGGHSLLAVTLFSRIEAEFGRRLPLAALFHNPTLGGLAGLLEPGKPAAPQTWRSLVTIRPGGDGPGIFLIHGAGGNILIYRSLAQYLTPGFPVHGLQSLGLDHITPPLHSVEEMAASYVDEITRSQPAGPYLILGYCMGGKIAFEVARLLTARGQTMHLLGLLDTYNDEVTVARGRLRFYAELAMFHLRNIFELRPAEAVSYVKEKVRMLIEAVQSAGSVVLTRVRWRLAGRREKPPVEQLIQKINDQAGVLFQPKPYAGRVTLFKPQRNYSGFNDPDMGWRTVAHGELERVELQLNPHAMLVEPYVRRLAEAINQRLPGPKP